jgi:tripartite ATP-independent transporter DctM subunit
VPGIALAILFALYVAVIAAVKPKVAPALPREVRNIETSVLIRRVLVAMLPPLVLILLVLGSIFTGIATPTEAGALGALGALGLALINRRLTIKALFATVRETTTLTTMVVFLLIGSTAFSLIFRGLYGDVWIDEMLLGLPGGTVSLLLVTNISIFILGFFIDFFEIAFIVVPLLAPVAAKLGIDMVWYGVMIGMNLQTSFLTPPFGFALFYLRGVAPPELKTTQIYRGAIPFILIQLVALLLVILFPELVRW